MSNDENIYRSIQDFLGRISDVNILEEQIDIDLQLEYFEYSRTVKKDIPFKSILSEKKRLFDDNYPAEDKKALLVKLASTQEVEGYRAIEKYLKNPDSGLRDWAVLASQECRMLLQSKLLGDNQVFISTGLGGRGLKLRYFLVLVNNIEDSFTGLQRKVIRSEFDFVFSKHEAEIEDIVFSGRYCKILAVIPLEVPVREMLRNTINEINQLGDFIDPNFIITNVRKLTDKEITEFIEKDKKNKTDDE